MRLIYSLKQLKGLGKMSKKIAATLVVILPFLTSCYRTSDLYVDPSLSDSCENLAALDWYYGSAQSKFADGVPSVERRRQLTKSLIVQKGCSSSLIADVRNKLENPESTPTSTNNIAAPSPLTAPTLTTPTPTARLGVHITPITPRIITSFGLPVTYGSLVLGTIPGGSAEKAGILAGDIILGVSGKTVANPNELTSAVAQLPPNSITTLQVWRLRESIDVSLTIAPGSSQSPLIAPSVPAPAAPEPTQKTAVQPASLPAISSGSYCVSVFTYDLSGSADSESGGIVTNIWKAESTNTSSALNSLPEFESYIRSQGHSFDVDSRTCQPPGTMDQCTIIGTKGFLTLKAYSLSTTCTKERQPVEAMRSLYIKKSPFFTVTSWAPAGSTQ